MPLTLVQDLQVSLLVKIVALVEGTDDAVAVELLSLLFLFLLDVSIVFLIQYDNAFTYW